MGTRFGYDGLNRLVRKATITGLTLVTFAYSASGVRTQMVDASGTHSYVHDALGRLKTSVTPMGTLRYSWDANGNLLSLRSTTANGVDLSWQYDALNRLTNVVDARLAGAQNTAYPGYFTLPLATLQVRRL